MCDILIKNGTIIDGTGSKPYIGDIAITNGVIEQVGMNLNISAAGKVIDATGLTVTPGWVDPHTHYDAQVMWDEYLTPSAPAGVTTLVMGNCAVGLAPCQKPMRQFVTDICDSIEDIPSRCITEAVNWEWETFPEYMAYMENKQFACDVGVLVGHGGVRSWVLGSKVNMSDRPNGQVEAPLTPDEIANVGKVVEEAIASGAIGFSTSRVSIHRDPAGVLLPGSLASHEELIAIGEAITRGGGGVFELASSWDLYDDFALVGKPDRQKISQYVESEWDWMGTVSKMDGVLFTTGHTPGTASSRRKELAYSHRDKLIKADKINREGGNIMVTPMMRNGQLFFGIGAYLNPLVVSKTYKKMVEMYGGSNGSATPGLFEKLRETDVKKAIIAECDARRTTGPVNIMVRYAEFIYPYSNDIEPLRENSLKFCKEKTGKEELEYMYDILTHPEESHGGILVRIMFNYGEHNLDAIIEMFLHPNVVGSFADGGAHMNLQCEATTQTTMLTFYTRDRSRGKKLPIELVVKKQTSDSARMMGLNDRGELRPGMRADVNVIDMNSLNCLPPRYKYDLPLGAGRWTQEVQGYRFTICNGVISFVDGVATGALPGRVVKNPNRTGIVANGLRGSVPPGPTDGIMDAKGMKEMALKLQSEGQGFSAIQKTLSNEASKL